jgi:gelsolin
MIKAKTYDPADSNIALLGSDIEKKVRDNAAKGEPAWKTAGKQLCDSKAYRGTNLRSGIEIWRIENFKVVAVPQEEFGKFYSGDSYIVLRVRSVYGTRTTNLIRQDLQEEAG